MQKREIAINVILVLVTCGIYGFVWAVFLANDLRKLANDEDKMSGGLVALFSVLTCGLFLLYWYYHAGKSIDKAKYMRNIPIEDAGSMMYLIFGVLGLGIVSISMIQNEVNNLIDVPVRNDGSGYDPQASYYNNYSQPYNNQSYYNNQNYNPNTYSNPNQNNYPVNNNNSNSNNNNFNSNFNNNFNTNFNSDFNNNFNTKFNSDFNSNFTNNYYSNPNQGYDQKDFIDPFNSDN